MSTYAVIMCGGSGSRLWPASRPARPKQFTPLVGDLSTFQETARRVQDVAGLEGLVVVAGAAHETAIFDQLAALGLSCTLIVEPEARDSAAAMAAACAWIAARDPDGVAVILAADHHVPDAAAFAAAASQAVQAASQGHIVTLGVQPTAPSSAYGYIAPGASLAGLEGVRKVAKFVEKPDTGTARLYIADGYLWNSGNFVVGARTLLDELTRFAPGVGEAASKAVAEAGQTSPVRLTDAFRAAPKISIDYAVMEKTDRAAVLPVAFDWSDLGAWDAVWTKSDKDEAGNAVSGRPVLVDVKNSLVQDRGGLTTVAIGVQDLAIITDGGQVLVCALDASQSVKAAYDQLNAEGRVGPTAPARSLLSWLDVSALPLWATIGVDDRGGFREEIAPDGRPTATPARVRVQARQAFVFGRAAARGWAGPGQAAWSSGIDALCTRYLRPDGLFGALPGSDEARLYDQAFVLLALSVDPAQQARAEALLDVIQATLRHPAGGYREFGDQAFLSNPHMHLFEAALAWEEAGGGARWAGLADEIAALCLTRFIDPDGGFLREVFDASWAPAPGRDGEIVEPGHQFEWAWLLERWARRRGDAGASEAARKLFAAGARGVDAVRNLAVNQLDTALAITDASARLWPQTERLKAALILGETAHIQPAVDSIWSYLEADLPGLWRDRQVPGKGFAPGPSPASSLYHLAVAIEELAASGRT